MTAETLIKYFDRISEAPDAVVRLRRFILDLAIRGKLVEQDPYDEPAEGLLKCIQAEKTRLANDGKYRGSTVVRTLAKNSMPFSAPMGWAWVSFGEIMISRDGERIPVSKEERNTRQKNYDYYGASGVIDKIDSYLFDKPLLLIGEDGANLINRSTPIAFIARGKYWVNNHAHVLDGISEDFLRFIELHINAIDLKPFVTGTAQPKMNQAKMNSIPIALPPMKEQHRIVAKVNELMALCDQLEAARNEREARRDRLVTASLHRIGTVTAMPVDARFHLDQLPQLSTRPVHIKQLRQTILNLAVRGRLVLQDPMDEPATELIKQLQAEKALLVTKGGSKKEAALPDVNSELAPFDIPSGWTWARFPELGVFGRGKSKHRPRNDSVLFDGGTHFLIQTGDVARSLGVVKTYTNKYNDIGLAQSMKWPAGTLCITIAANIADTGILSFDACFPDSVVGFTPAAMFPNARYFEYFMRTAKANLLEFAPATAQKNINLEILNSVLIPLPPLAEQQRIVARVDQLMRFCDELEAQLVTTETDSCRLLEAVLRDALTPPL